MNCHQSTPERSHPNRSLRLASTIGPVDAGIVPALLEAYRAARGVEVALTATGTGQALDLARQGGADLVIVHAPRLEAQFIADGFGLARYDLMANDFVLVGPAEDPAGVRGQPTVSAALRRLAASGALFLTRGDRSGTHVKEIELWQAAGVALAGPWYRQAGRGSAGNLATAREAAALGHYTLLDRATVLTLRDKLGLDVLVEGDPLLLNVISMLPVNPSVVPDVQAEAAAQLAEWLLADEAQRLIAEFGLAEYGRPLFYPRAPSWRARTELQAGRADRP